MLGTSRTKSVTGVEPISLATAKKQLKVEWASEDDLIEDFICSARAHAENVLFRCLVDQTRTAYFDCFYPVMEFFGPAVSVQSVTYLDEDGAEQTLASSAYRLSEGEVAAITPTDEWPTVTVAPDSVKINYTCEPGIIDPSALAAIRLALSKLYANREDPVAAKRTLSDNLLATTRNRVM
jgi:uncharacterized phiE125 gp8 family phage protein